MAVAFDSVTSTISGSNVTSLTTGSFTIAGTNRAGIVFLRVDNNAISAITGDIGGTSATAVSGADTLSTNADLRLHLRACAAPPSGSQTASCAWTTAAIAEVGVITAKNVDQTTPVNGGQNTQGDPVTSLSLNMVSPIGDLTATASATLLGTAPTTNRTSRYTDSFFGAGDTGPGTVDPTHTWSTSSTTMVIAGANFVARVVQPGDGGGTADDRYRFRNSVVWSGTSTRGTWRSSWPDNAGYRDPSRDAFADRVTAVF